MKQTKNRIRLVNIMALLILLFSNFSPVGVVVAEGINEGSDSTYVTALEEEVDKTLTEDTSQAVAESTSQSELTSSEESLAANSAVSKPLAESVATEKTAETEEAKKVAKKQVPAQTKRITKQLTILGTSDVHGNVWDWSYEDDKAGDFGFAKIGTIVKDVRATQANTILVDAGDNLQGTLLTDDLYSKDASLQNVVHPVIAAMNVIGYDAMALGNHEFNFGTALIEKANKDAKFPLLSANTYFKGTEKNLTQAYEIVVVDGLRVGILGLTIPHVPMWDGDKVKHLEFKSLRAEAKKQVKIMQEVEKTDVIVASIHAGLDNSDPEAAARNVITEVPEIDAFVLGHDHREFAEKHLDENGKEKPAGAVRDTGSGVVRIDLEVSKDEVVPEAEADEALPVSPVDEEEIENKWEVTKSDISIISSKNQVTDEAVRDATLEAHEKTQAYVKGVIGKATGDFLPAQEVKGIPEAQLQPTAMISLINRVQMHVTGADIGAGALFKADSKLAAGDITFADIFDIYKYPNTLVKASMNGSQLKKYMEKQASYYQQYEEGDLTIAFNPKIRVYNYDMLTGVNYKIDISKEVGQRIVDLTFKGKPVTDDQALTIAINNYRFEGMVTDGFVDPVPLSDTDPDTLRGEIVKYIKEFRNGEIDPAVEIENSFEVIGADLSHPLRDYVIKQINDGAEGFDLIKVSSDKRTPNVAKVNINTLIAEGKIPAEMLGDQLTIMHTNDMHGRLEYLEDKYSPSIGIARVKAFKDLKKPTLLVDAGDAMQGLPISNYTKGMDMVKAMNETGYDAMTLGNHEFDFGLETALAYKKELNFPIVSANVYYKADQGANAGKRPFDPYTMTKKMVGKKEYNFALIGLTTPETSVKTHPKNVEKVTFTEPAPEAIDVINEIKKSDKKADAFVFMTHLGFDETTAKKETSKYLADELAKAFPDDKIFIIDGHSHSELKNGHKSGHIIMGQTGNHLNNVGMISANYSGAEPVLTAKLHPFSELKDLTPDPAVQAIVDEAAANFKEVMKEVVIDNNPVLLNGTREFVRAKETNLGNLIGDAIYEYGINGGFKNKTDFAIVNGGGIRQNINPGVVTQGDIVGVMPFGNTVTQIKVSGQTIYDMFEQSLHSIHATNEAGEVILDSNGLPALGANGGFLQVSDSIKVKYDSNKQGAVAKEGTKGERVFSIQLRDAEGNFKEIDKEKADYYVATNDFLAAGGDGFTMLGGEKEEGSSMDTVLMDHLKKMTIKDLEAYKEEFPGSRIISELSEEVASDKFTIMHTNDIHGRLEYLEDKYSPSIGMGRVKAFKDQVKPTLLVDAGDAMQGLPISNYTKGMDMVKVMNETGYDAMTLGNHEFDFGLETALAYKEALNFPIVSANVYYKANQGASAGKRPFNPYTTVNKKVGTKDYTFALIGLTTPETTVKTHPKNVEKVEFTEPAPEAIKVINEIKKSDKKADAFVFMTHLGFDETTAKKETSKYLADELAKAFPDDKIFIIDGHSHSELKNGHKSGHIIMGQTGNHLNNVGMISANYSGAEPVLTAKLHPFSELKDLTPDPAVQAIVDEAAANFKEVMKEVVIDNNPVLLNGTREFVRAKETNLGNLIGDAIYEYGINGGFKNKTDFAIVNGGGIRQNINPGVVTQGDIVGVMPFGNTVTQIKVSGQTIYDMFEQSLHSIHATNEAGEVILDSNGLPALGANGGFLQVSDSIKVKYDSNKQGAVAKEGTKGERVFSIQLRDAEGNFKEIDKEKADYYVATNDFLAAGGDGFTMLGGEKEEGSSMDTVLMDHLKKMTIKDLEAYKEEFPGSRIISELSEEVPAKKDLDLTKLQASITKAEKLQAKDYLPNPWKDFVAAIETAKAIYQQGDNQNNARKLIVQAEIDEAVIALEKAIATIKEHPVTAEPKPEILNLVELKAAITKAEKLQAKDYKKAAWSDFSQVLTEAQVFHEAAKKQNAARAIITNQDVQAMTKRLNAAMVTLAENKVTTPPVLTDQEKLEKAIQEALKLAEKNYTAESWKLFQKALKEAQTALAANQYEEGLKLLEKGLASLVKKTPQTNGGSVINKVLPQTGEEVYNGLMQGIIIVMTVSYGYAVQQRRKELQ